MRARKEQKDEFLTLLALLLIMKALRKAIARAERGYNRMDHMDNHF